MMEPMPGIGGFGSEGKPWFWITDQRRPTTENVHVAFTAPDRATVDAFHAKALEAGRHRTARRARALPPDVLRRLRARSRRQQRRGGLPPAGLTRRQPSPARASDSTPQPGVAKHGCLQFRRRRRRRIDARNNRLAGCILVREIGVMRRSPRDSVASYGRSMVPRLLAQAAPGLATIPTASLTALERPGRTHRRSRRRPRVARDGGAGGRPVGLRPLRDAPSARRVRTARNLSTARDRVWTRRSPRSR